MDSFNNAYLTNPGFPLIETYYKPVIRSESEGNYIHVRSRTSRGRHTWELKWEYIDDSELQGIKDFFEDHQGVAFYWTHPVDNNTYTCIFADDRLTSELVAPNYWRVTVRLEEV